MITTKTYTAESSDQISLRRATKRVTVLKGRMQKALTALRKPNDYYTLDREKVLAAIAALEGD